MIGTLGSGASDFDNQRPFYKYGCGLPRFQEFQEFQRFQRLGSQEFQVRIMNRALGTPGTPWNLWNYRFLDS
jgi:hypothetical protein